MPPDRPNILLVTSDQQHDNTLGCQDLKHQLVMKLLFAEMGKEPLWMPRVYGA